MKDKLIKVKRKTVDWYSVYCELCDPDIDRDFYLFVQDHPKMSLNRCAYNVLKKHYSTTAMTRFRFTGSFYE